MAVRRTKVSTAACGLCVEVEGTLTLKDALREAQNELRRKDAQSAQLCIGKNFKMQVTAETTMDDLCRSYNETPTGNGPRKRKRKSPVYPLTPIFFRSS